MKQETSAGYVVYRQASPAKPREYLILAYPEGHFDFPKGHLEPHETPLQAAKRELQEETSITDFQHIDGYHETIKYKFKNWVGIMVDKTVHFYLAKVNNPQIKVSDEHIDFIWLEYEAAIKKITFNNARQLLIKAEQQLINTK